MKKLLFFIVLTSASLLSTTLFGLVSYNFGFVGGFDIEISSYYLKNCGTYAAANSATFNTTYLSNTGSISAGSKLNITNGETLSGSGSFSAPTISITSKTFTFSGSISCSKRCVIKLGEPISLDTFTASGSGEFLIFDRNNFQQIIVKLPGTYYLEEVNADMPEDKRKQWFNICASELLQKFKDNALRMSDDDINLIHEQLVHCAKKLYLEDSHALKRLKKIVDDCVSYYEPLKDKKRNETALTVGALLATVGVIAGTYGYKKSQAGVGTCGAVAGLAGLVGLYYGLNPNYKESYERSCAVQKKLAELDE